MDRLNISRVAVVGAGPGGLAAAKYLVAEAKFAEIDIFEQRRSPGGVWNYTIDADQDDKLAVPRTRPSQDVDRPVKGAGGPDFVSPLYDFLETNIPHSLMNFTDQPFPEGTSLFPRHQVVLKYLQDYAADLVPHLRLGRQVVSVVPKGDDKWAVSTRDVASREETTKVYDAVVCCSGHYSDPFIPDIAGIGEFNDTHPGVISHSKYYRRPEEYKDKRVVVVGNSASGLDLSSQISAVSKGPVLVSEKTLPASSSPVLDNKEYVPEIVEFVASDRGVRFANGRVEHAIDHVIFCTGYQYSFPFLRSLDPPAITTGLRTEHVYQHIFYHPRPTLSFIGLPQRVVPFPTAEAQAGAIARVLSGRLALPSREAMQAWETELLEAGCGGDARMFHSMAYPKDAAYINALHDWSMSAAEGEDDARPANGGRGKVPPYWGEDKQWVRERFPSIKAASRKLGARRHEVTSLEELGFDFAQWKSDNSHPN